MKHLLKNWLSKNRCISTKQPLNMYAKGLFGLLLMININCFSQINLVPNYSFENYTTCPTTSGQIVFAMPWQIPNNGTPDYFNSCSSTFGVPSYCNCSSVYQQPNFGDAYVGIWCWNYITDTREYIQVQLLDTLTSTSCYLISFYTNLINWAGLACNNIGTYLSDTAISSTSLLMEYPSQIKNFNNKIITDTLNWNRIEGIYVANGNELFLTIGNFNNDLSTDTVTVNSSSSFGAYYYIDDVSVLPIDSIPGGMPAYAGVDTSVTLGDSVFIGQQISNLNCNWYNAIGSLIASGTSGIYVSPTTTTSFVVEQELCGTITYDTVKVSVTTNINELFNVNNVQIYPNPTNGELTLELLNQNNEWLTTILDVQGRTVLEKSFTGTKINLKLELANGVYFVKITNQNTNEMVMKKLIVNE